MQFFGKPKVLKEHIAEPLSVLLPKLNIEFDNTDASTEQKRPHISQLDTSKLQMLDEDHSRIMSEFTPTSQQGADHFIRNSHDQR